LTGKQAPILKPKRDIRFDLTTDYSNKSFMPQRLTWHVALPVTQLATNAHMTLVHLHDAAAAAAHKSQQQQPQQRYGNNSDSSRTAKHMRLQCSR
jgi:hypothetical protein